MHKFSPTSAQEEALAQKGNLLIVGPAGCGKTSVLMAKVAQLVEKGVPAHHIAVVAFSYRSLKLIQNMMLKNHPVAAKDILFQTLKDFASDALPHDSKKPFATNNQVRDLLKKAMAEQQFKGSLGEAENIIRTLKGRSRRCAEDEPHFHLLQSYKALLEKENLTDRHDLVRQHILGLRNETMPLARAKYILIDNVQDATQIQLVWMQEHMKAGIPLMLAANDDVTLFGRDGALGADAITALKALPMQAVALSTVFRTPQAIADKVFKTARLLKDHIPKKEKSINEAPATIKAENFTTEKEEVTHLITYIKDALSTNAGGRIGLIVRHDYIANTLFHQLVQAGLRPASYARPIWEKAGAGTILSMLYLVLGQSNSVRFGRMLTTHLGADVAEKMLEAGITPEDFLRQSPLPATLKLTADAQREVHTLRRRVASYIRLMQAGDVTPRDVFKATVADTLPKLTPEEQEDALLATRILLSLKGKLADLLPRLEQETLPDMHSNIVIAPVREVRNMEFDTLILPRFTASNWPASGYRVLGPDPEHERRLLHTALTRAKGNIHLTHSTENGQKPSPYLREVV